MALTIRRLAFASTLLVAAQAAGAQTAAIPNSNQVPPPDTVRLPSREQVEVQDRPTAPPSTARVESAGALTAAPCALEESSVRVTLGSIRFETPDGGAIAPALQALLAPAAAAPAGEQPISVVCRVRDRVNELLSDAGYIALAQIPAQEIAGGELRIQIVAGKIIEVRILGEPGPFRREIERRVAALRALDPLNRHDAERILLTTSDVPGVSVTLALSPAQAKPGELIGTLTVATQRVQVLANVQNYGSGQLGPWVGSLRAEAYGLTGLADRTYVAYSNSFDLDEIHVLQAGHDFALGAGGLRAAVRGSLAFSQPSIGFELRSRSTIFSAELNQLLVRSVPARLTLGAGLELLEQRSVIQTGQTSTPYTRDRLRMAYARLDGSLKIRGESGFAANFDGTAELRQGTGLFGASREGSGTGGGYEPSRNGANPQATVLRGDVQADLRTPTVFSLGLAAFGQWASDPLLNLEEFSLGNYTYGRGYDPGSNGGDRALAFRVEPRVRVPLKLPVSVELTGFFDWVRLSNLGPSASERERTLRSVGGGVRVTLPGRVALDAVYAEPLDRTLLTDTRRHRGRVLVSLTTQLFPWGGR